jgi:hypothetical protein
MGSPLSPVMANLFMEEFEKKALATATLKPGFWFRYVDDTLSSWSHGLDNLQKFLATLIVCIHRSSLLLKYRGMIKLYHS